MDGKQVLTACVGVAIWCGGGLIAWDQYQKYQVRQAEIRAQEEKKAAVASCDKEASHPSDPQRVATPVADDKVALGPAMEACSLAIQLSPETARLRFQLGRLLWLANKDSEAVLSFVEAYKLGHVAAAKYLGDAHFEARGLPAGVEPSDEEALTLYQRAKNGGFAGIGTAITMAEDRLRRSKFNPALFQYSEYMQAIHAGNFDDFQAPVGLAYYAKGLVSALDAEPSFFMDLKCKPLLNIVGNNVAQYADLIAAAVLIKRAKDRTSDQVLADFMRAGFDNFVQSVYYDYGKRDGIVLFDKEVYGCDSPVTKQVASNLMNRLKLIK